MERANDLGASNNYNNFFYSPLPSFKIEKGIDYLTLSFSISKTKSLYSLGSLIMVNEQFFHDFLISNGYDRKSHSMLEGYYEFKDSYVRATDGNTVELSYRPKVHFIPYLLVKIHDPILRIVNMFQSFFKKHYLSPKLSDLELRFDFYTDEVIKMREFLKRHLCLRYQRSISSSYKTTFYTNNLRKDTKGMRIYSRKGWNHVRMELRLRGTMLKRLNIAFPLNTVDDLDLSRFFLFMEIDTEKLFEYLKWAARDQFKMLAQKRRPFLGLLEQTIYQWMRGLLTNDNGDKKYFMEGIEALKLKYNNIPNHSRFLLPMVDFNAEFHRQVSGQVFLC